MKVTINGKDENISAGPTVLELLAIKSVKMPEMVSVELNDRILNRSDFGTIRIQDGDRIEFLYFMGGGR